jgi:hypothetical protein
MPELVGMTLEEAQVEMRKEGFTNEERIRVQFVTEPGCEPTVESCIERRRSLGDRGYFANLRRQ